MTIAVPLSSGRVKPQLAATSGRVLTLKRSTDRNLAAFVTVKWVKNIKSIVSQAIDCLLAWNQDFL
jgi:hypothetical protein